VALPVHEREVDRILPDTIRSTERASSRESPARASTTHEAAWSFVDRYSLYSAREAKVLAFTAPEVETSVGT
jgi:hypothetical protein